MNIKKLMKQAASMQADMATLQKELAEREISFSSGGGMVSATARGDGSLSAIRIDPKVVDPNDVEMIEDLVLTAVQGAQAAARDMSQEEMGRLTSGLGLPGMSL